MGTHKKPESERFKGPVKYAEYLLARAVVSLLQRLPIGLAYRLGRGTGWLAWKTMRRRRATVRKNLEIVNAWLEKRAEGGGLRPEFSGNDSASKPAPAQVSDLKLQRSESVSGLRSRPSLEFQVREVFQRAGANLFCGFTFNRMSAEQAGQHIRIEGIEHLQAALDERKGVIVLLAHMGPWEALTQLPALARKQGIDAPFGAMYRPLNNAYLDAWFKSQREGQGTRLFSRRDGFHKPVDFLRAGGMLGILADQKLKRGETVTFFGREAKTSPIAGLMQRRSKAASLCVSVSTGTALNWTLKIRPFKLPSDFNERDRMSESVACNRALERALSDSPLDGFWFHDRF